MIFRSIPLSVICGRGPILNRNLLWHHICLSNIITIADISGESCHIGNLVNRKRHPGGRAEDSFVDFFRERLGGVSFCDSIRI